MSESRKRLNDEIEKFGKKCREDERFRRMMVDDDFSQVDDQIDITEKTIDALEGLKGTLQSFVYEAKQIRGDLNDEEKEALDNFAIDVTKSLKDLGK